MLFYSINLTFFKKNFFNSHHIKKNFFSSYTNDLKCCLYSQYIKRTQGASNVGLGFDCDGVSDLYGSHRSYNDDHIDQTHS